VHPPADWRDSTVHVLDPDGTMREVPVTVQPDGVLAIAVPVGDRPGSLDVDIDGTGAEGPGKLVQLTVWIGDPPRRATLPLPSDDPPGLADDMLAAEAHALTLLAADRAAHGVPPVVADPGLTAIARAHSLDMMIHGYFGHRSPTTGLASDRLAAASYHARRHGENLARNDSLGGAEASLLASVGHRANLLEPRFTKVGVGLARDRDGAWFVTQLFATPTEQLGDATATALIATIAEQRARAGASPLELPDDLAAVARDGAHRAATGRLDGLASQVADSAGRHVVHGAAVSVQVVYAADEIEVPDGATDPGAASLAVAAWQDPSALDGRTGVVIIVGR